MSMMTDLDRYKDHLNQQVLQLVPESLQPMVSEVLPHYWQEWTLLLVGGPFIAIFLLEWAYQKSKGKAERISGKRAVTNFSLGAVYITFEVFAKALIIIPACLWLYQFRLFTIEVTWLTALPIFLAVELCYYCFHRASHRITWFWSAHVVHHSDDRMNLSTAMRQSLLYSVVGWWWFFVPVILLGVHPIWVFFFYALDLIYQYFIHTEVVDKLPPWAEYIFNTPSNHRAHHGTNADYIDKNYGGVVMIYDHLFGTYVKEDSVNNPVRYGAVGENTTDNLFSIIFAVFGRMWRNFFQQKSINGKVKAIVQPPEEEH